MVHSKITQKVVAALVALAFATAAAYAQDKSKDKGDAPPQNSGFLADYSHLTPAPDNPKLRRWVSKEFDFKPYDKVLLVPIEVWVSPTSEYKGASPDVLKRMTDDFNATFKKALQPGYQLVDKPGPGVLQLRLAITGVNLVKPQGNPTDYLPIMFIIKSASGARSAKNVVLTAEMQVLDPDNKLVAAAVTSGTGDKSIQEKQEITWKELSSIAGKWAENLRKGLDTARGVAAK